MNREERLAIFNDTLSRSCHDPDMGVPMSIDSGEIFTEPLEAEAQDGHSCVVVNNTSFGEAAKYASDKAYNGRHIGVLNFASATHPGGGVTRGSSAQEESLCRESTLYAVLSYSKFNHDFYSYHRNQHNMLYSSRVIYTPDIKVFKDSNGNDLSSVFAVDVFSCAAPNLRDKSVRINDKDLLNLLVERYTNLLNIVQSKGIDVFITGAIGCGAFRNDPFIVARSWKQALRDSSFTGECVFAVYCRRGEEENFNTFKRVLG